MGNNIFFLPYYWQPLVLLKFASGRIATVNPYHIWPLLLPKKKRNKEFVYDNKDVMANVDKVGKALEGLDKLEKRVKEEFAVKVRNGMNAEKAKKEVLGKGTFGRIVYG